VIADNCWYGHRRVLADYCGLPEERPIHGNLVHGWYWDIPSGMGRSRFVNAPVFFWNLRHVEQARRAGVVRPRCVGAPFIYAVTNLGIDPGRSGHGTLVFHAHSAERVSVNHDLSALAQRVMDVADPPYTLSVYYQDQSPAITDWCATAGWRSITFGDRADRRFLYRAAMEISSHDTVITEGFQTATWYGAYLGRSVRVLPRDHESESDVSRVVGDARQEMWVALIRGMPAQDATEVGAGELGSTHTLAPRELAETLGWCSIRRQTEARAVMMLSDLRFGRGARSGHLSDRVVDHLERRESGGGPEGPAPLQHPR